MDETKFDFCVPSHYRGKNVNLFPTGKITDNQIVLKIPANAFYVGVKSLEDDEEFYGIQGLSDRQEISYYDLEEKFIESQSLEDRIVTFKLTRRLEKIFIKQY